MLRVPLEVCLDRLCNFTRTSDSTFSLLRLNFESMPTAVIAGFVLKENADRRIVPRILAVVAGGVVLSWPAAIGERTIASVPSQKPASGAPRWILIRKHTAGSTSKTEAGRASGQGVFVLRPAQ